MAKKRFLSLVVPIVILLAACAPDSGAKNPPVAATEAPREILPTTTQIAPAEEATILPVATSRGPELHATDPTSVSLASGGLQFVEFFRFT